MIQESLKPNKVQDIISRVDEYLAAMRSMGQGAVELVAFLEKYIQEYFAKSNDLLDLKKAAVEFTDEMYVKISGFELRDIHTNGYFGIVVNRFFWELSQKGVLCFFVLDNHLRDDRFKMTVELYDTSGFTPIYPYAQSELKYSEEFTKLAVSDYKTVEKAVDGVKAQKIKRHILYVEKDDSVNYIQNVLRLAEGMQSDYVCIYRNKAPSEHPNANWLMGSFADLIK